MRGYFGIGIEHTKCHHNIGTLWRSAHIFGAQYIFTIGKRYTRQASDVLKSWRELPLFHYADLQDMWSAIPYDCKVIGIELDDRAEDLHEFKHPERAVYLLGAEDHGLSSDALSRCHGLVKIPTWHALNVATTGSIVMYDRKIKAEA